MINEKSAVLLEVVAGAGFEPTTFGLWARRATKLLHPAFEKRGKFYADNKQNASYLE